MCNGISEIMTFLSGILPNLLNEIPENLNS